MSVIFQSKNKSSLMRNIVLKNFINEKNNFEKIRESTNKDINNKRLRKIQMEKDFDKSRSIIQNK